MKNSKQMKQLLSIISRNLSNPWALAIKLLAKASPLIKSDRLYLSWRYRLFMHKRLNLSNPQTFNEKLNWMKLNYHNPIYSKLVDKYEVKKIVSGIIGAEHVIPTLGVWDRVDDIDFGNLPNRFVLKCTHDSGGLVICKDKSTLNIEATKSKLGVAMKRNYFSISREWAYKHVPPRIIAEQYMEDKTTHALNDFKFFCFNGKVKVLFIATERASDVKFDFFDNNFRHLNVINGHPLASVTPQKPKTFDQMIILAEKLSAGYPFMRVDLYEVNGKVYFGEYTVYHYGGTVPFEPADFDLEMGSWITLPNPII